MRDKIMYFWVGILMILAMLSMMFLAYQVSGFSARLGSEVYSLSASFTNIGALRPNAPVRVAGVKVGAVKKITLNPKTYRAAVVMRIKNDMQFPVDTSARILTEGLLGSNYIELTPGFEEDMLKHHGVIHDTQSAILLENIISKLVYDGKK